MQVKQLRWMGILFGMAAAVALCMGSASAEERWALLIGASQFDDPAVSPVSSAANDIKALGDAIEKAGFSREHILSIGGARATRSVLIVGLRDALKKLGPDDVFYMHYSGRSLKGDSGAQVLATKDTSTVDPVNTGLPFSLVTDMLRMAATGHIFVTLDCRHDPTAEFAKLAADKRDAMLVTAACDGINTTFGESGDGALTHFMVEEIKRGGNVTASDCAKAVAGDLGKWLDSRGAGVRPVVLGAEGGYTLLGGAATRTAKAETPGITPIPAKPLDAAATKPKEDRGNSPVSVQSLAPPPPVDEPIPVTPLQNPGQPPATTPGALTPPPLPLPTTQTGPVALKLNRKWALVVGISKYQSTNYAELPTATPSATLMRETLVNDMKFEPGNITLLTDAQATRDAIMHALEGLKDKVRPGDLMYFYYAGHAALRPSPMGDGASGQWYVLYPNDTQPTGEGTLAFSLVEGALSYMSASQIVVALETRDAAAAAPQLEKLATPWLLFGACESGQSALGGVFQDGAGNTQRHGVFTHFLAEALRGGADKNSDGLVTADEAQQHIVKAFAENKVGQQTPVLLGKPTSLVLAGTPRDINAQTQAAMTFSGQPAATTPAPVVAPTVAPTPLTDIEPDVTPLGENAKTPIDKATAAIRHWSLVVGINKYKAKGLPELPGAVNDSKEVSSLLQRTLNFEKAGMTVLNDDNASRQTLLGALHNLAEKSDEDDTVLFYFSGHSIPIPKQQNDIESDNELALCPNDANLSDTGALVTVREAADILMTAGAKHIVIVLETSHAGVAAPFAEHIAKNGKTCAILAACGAQETTMDAAIPLDSGGTRSQGAFTYYLARALKGEASKKGDKNIAIKDAMGYVKEKLEKQGYKQHSRFFGGPAELVLYQSAAKEEPKAKAEAPKAEAPKTPARTEPKTSAKTAAPAEATTPPRTPVPKRTPVPAQ